MKEANEAEIKRHLQLGNVLRGATCIAPLLAVCSCGGNPDVGGKDEATQNIIGHVDPKSRGAVLTSRNDNFRTGANLFESELKPSNVKVSSFGLRYTRNLDGKIFAQPLFVPDVVQFRSEGWKVSVTR